MRILAIVAHPDDESLFAGAMLARHAADGCAVHVVALSDGVGSRYRWWQFIARDVAAFERRRDFDAACEVLGVRGTILVAFPDQQADTRSQLRLNRIVNNLIADHNPTLVYTHHVGDLNRDHRCVAEAVLVATRSGPTVRCMTPEYPSRCVGPKFDPNIHVLLTNEDIQTKLRACGHYLAEMQPFPHPRSDRAIRRQHHEQFMEIR